jgi:hypothetical protein
MSTKEGNMKDANMSEENAKDKRVRNINAMRSGEKDKKINTMPITTKNGVKVSVAQTTNENPVRVNAVADPSMKESIITNAGEITVSSNKGLAMNWHALGADNAQKNVL